MKLLTIPLCLLGHAGFAQAVNPAFLVNDKVTVPIIKSAREGLFAFKDGFNSYGYVDKNMKVVLPAVYQYGDDGKPESAASFYNGRAVVKKQGKWQVIDKSGKTLSPLFDDQIRDYNLGAGLYLLKDRNLGSPYVVNAEGRKILKEPIDPEIELDSNLIVSIKPNPLIKGVKIHTLTDAKGTILLRGEGLDQFDLIKVYRREGVIMARDLAWNYLFDLKLKPLLKLPRIFDPSKYRDMKAVDQILGNAKDYFMKNPSGGERQMDFSEVSKGRIFFGDKYLGGGYVDGSKYGLMDFKGIVVMEPRYETYWGGFDEYGMCFVTKGNIFSGKSTYIDRNGRELFPPDVKPPTFRRELSSVLAQDPKTGLYGVMDRSGKWVIQPTFAEVGDLDVYGGFQAKKKDDNSFYYLDITGKNHGKITPSGSKWFLDPYGYEDGYFMVTVPDSTIRVADDYGRLSQPISDCMEFGEFSEGLAPIRAASNRKIGFVDSSGKVVIRCVYDNATPFKDGVSLVSIIEGGKRLSGYIDRKGKVILPLQYEKIGVFSDGHGIIQTETGFSYVDRTGKLKTPPAEFGQYFSEFKSGLAIGGRDNGKGSKTFTYFDKDFRKAFSFDGLYAGPFNGNVAIARITPNVISLIDRKGAKIKDLPPGLQGIDFFGAGKFGVKYNRKWGFMNEKGEMVIQPKYDSVSAFNNYFAAARLNGKWGLIDEYDNKKMDFSYEQMILGDYGMVACGFIKGGLWDVQKSYGETIFENLRQPVVYREGWAIVRPGKKYCIARSPLAK